MNETNATHPSLADLAAFDAGQLAPAAREAIERHLALCSECGRRVDTLPEDPFVALVRASAAPHTASSTDTPEPILLNVPDALARHPRYRILGVLGAGGMGIVYKAVHRVLDRVVALKVLHRRFTDHPDFVERFRQEAQAIARLSHPHIALAHDAEQAGELHFLVMEHVPGMSLDRLVAERGPLPIAEACEYVRQAALGLQHAFEHGLIHCDVKPQNLMRTPSGQIKVLDFGLVRLARESGEETAPSVSGAFAGTPDYTAPEQARDPHRIDIRADVYGLGCTLQFLLTGQPPFPGGSALQKLLAHQDRPPRAVSQFRDDVPAELRHLLEHMLAKEPAERPATPAEVARALAPFAVSVEEMSGTRSNRWLWLWLSASAAFLAVSFAVVVVLLVLAWPRLRQPASPTDTGQQADNTPASPPRQSPTSDRAQPKIPPVAVAVDPLALATPEQMVQLRRQRRDQAVDWLREHHAGPEGTLIQDLVASFDRYPDAIDGYLITIAGRLVRSGQPTLLAAAPGGFFVFPLSAEQLRALGVKEGGLRFYNYRNIAQPRRALPRVQLTDLKIKRAERLDLSGEISGSVAYEVKGPAIRGPFAVGVSRYLVQGKCQTLLVWFDGRTLEGKGTLEFTCPPPTRANPPLRGPVVLFAEIFSNENGKKVVESNTAAALVDTVSKPNP